MNSVDLLFKMFPKTHCSIFSFENAIEIKVNGLSKRYEKDTPIDIAVEEFLKYFVAHTKEMIDNHFSCKEEK